MNDHDWDLIVERIRENKCVPFLGAGASLGFKGPGLPTGGELAQQLAVACKYPGADTRDLFRVAQFWEMTRDRLSLQEKISTLLRVPGVQPSLVHKSLARLPIPYVVTTNFDNLMEKAFEENEEKPKTPTVATYQMRGDAVRIAPGTASEPLVYKLHGSISIRDQKLIVTEDDVVEFLCCLMLRDPPLPDVITALFERYSILFIGYGLKDWNIRVMLRALRGGRRAQSAWVRSFAIQRKPDDPALCSEWETTVAYWDKEERLKCFDMDAIDFCTELVRRFEAATVPA